MQKAVENFIFYLILIHIHKYICGNNTYFRTKRGEFQYVIIS